MNFLYKQNISSVTCTCVDYTIDVLQDLFINSMEVAFSKAKYANVTEQTAFVSFECGQEVFWKLKTVAVFDQDFH